MRGLAGKECFLPFGAGPRECLGRQFAAGQVRVVFSATALDLVTDIAVCIVCLHKGHGPWRCHLLRHVRILLHWFRHDIAQSSIVQTGIDRTHYAKRCTRCTCFSAAISTDLLLAVQKDCFIFPKKGLKYVPRVEVRCKLDLHVAHKMPLCCSSHASHVAPHALYSVCGMRALHCKCRLSPWWQWWSHVLRCAWHKAAPATR